MTEIGCIEVECVCVCVCICTCVCVKDLIEMALIIEGPSHQIKH